MSEPTVRVTRYEVSCCPDTSINRDRFTITVEYRDDDRWAVCHGGDTLGADGTWEFEPIPTDDGAWLTTHRFTLDQALRLAKDAAPKLAIEGHTVAAELTRADR